MSADVVVEADERSSKFLIYAVVSNIPRLYHSSDLRNFFSEFIETKGFDCFHFRHRPAIHKTAESTSGDRNRHGIDSDETRESSQKTTCCIIRLSRHKMDKLVKMYHGKHWLDKDGHTLLLKCFITRIRVTDNESCKADIHQINYKTRKEKRIVPTDRVTFTTEDLQNLAELRPPSIMPNGNVGTPTTAFLDLIRACRMPARMIGKLGLIFPKIRGKRMYGSVPYSYGGDVTVCNEMLSNEECEVRSGKGHILTDVYMKPLSSLQDHPEGISKEQHISEDESGDSDGGEEWDRHEALHDDVTEQGRTKERLYEEEIELKWEKGGSGLVFYTDAQYWDEQRGDFDERTADDWDVDTSIYYDPGGGDKDAIDYVQMLTEDRRRSGMDTESAFTRKIGHFEKHTKGIGRRLLEKQGWKDGQGLGKTIQGMPHIIDNDGQHPRNKRGFGYHGEKLPRFTQKRLKETVRISTIYDKRSQVDPSEPLLRRNPTTTLKHRSRSLNFQKADNS